MRTFVYILTRPFVWFWKLLSSGLTVLSNLLFLALFLIIITALFYTPKTTVPENSALLLAPVGGIVEQRSPMDPMARIFNNLAGKPLHEETFLQDVLDAVHTAADDPRISLLIINTDRMGPASLDQIKAIGLAIDHFKQTGKEVVAMGNTFNQAQYYLASWADRIYLHPMGGVQLRGFSLFRLYMRDLLDKLAVNVHVFRAGAFKTALEPFVRNDMSPEEREASSQWLGNLWDLYCTDIATNRKVTVTSLQADIDNLILRLASVNGDRGRMALTSGLIDDLKTHREMEDYLRSLVGPGPQGKGYNHISLDKYLQTLTPSYTDTKKQEDLIGIIIARGTIMYGKGAVGQIGSTPLVSQIRQARQDPRVKAIVLRIHSGGGSAFASELIRQELMLAQQEGKPVVVSMAAVAASGAYWLAANADSIVAAPVTLTGSIGVFGAAPTLEQTLAKIGMYGDGIGTTNTAQFGNPATAMGDDERAVLQMQVDTGYEQFIDIIAQGRNMSRNRVMELAQGKVWDGTTAHRLGLVDTLGYLSDAIAEARRLADIPEATGTYIDAESVSIIERLKRLERPLQTLAQRIQPSVLSGLPSEQLADQFDFLLTGGDPHSLYAHSLLPTSAGTFE
ncbi:signal peptide peptidase SppA [Desulfobulbus alkaliphilus]|uniref:signal peptide peptidase SppA n=1 Tax=Desulfobulbus alkaliphilus TaxID=869814 RepID=UPI0019634662|nr:signal peptide peptidase SppA [Desulfobulbus alkaliphilus]MBM9536360.1 signal peptide peptidase SppA [Desulfobulbus alkaliphilus]